MIDFKGPSLSEMQKMIQAIIYSGVELQKSEPIPYEASTSLIQKRIERVVTNNRGYLSVQDALNVVNKESPNLHFYDVLDTGFVPLYFEKKDKLKYLGDSPIPCGEISLGEPMPLVLYKSLPPLTLLGELKMAQIRESERIFRDKNPHSLFPPDFRPALDFVL